MVSLGCDDDDDDDDDDDNDDDDDDGLVVVGVEAVCFEAASDRKAGRRNRNVPEKPMSAADWLAMKRAEAGLVDLGEAQAHGSA